MAKSKKAAERRDPTEDEKSEGDAAAHRIVAERERRAAERSMMPRLGQNGRAVACPHSDANGWSAQLVESLGLIDGRVGNFLVGGALGAGFGPAVRDDESAGQNIDATEQAMAFVSEMQPQSPVEAALILQMAACHSATMDLARHAKRAEMRDQLADFSRMMNATMRTFTGQVEALNKLRTGGKQQVEVRYVYVDARNQTVIAGGGGADAIPCQSHAPGVLGYATAPGLPVWSADAAGDALPVASGEGAAPVPDARGAQPWPSARPRQRQLSQRPVDAAGRGAAGGRSRSAGGVS